MQLLLIQTPCWVVRTPPYNLALLKAVCASSGHLAHCQDLNIQFYHHLKARGECFVYENSTNWYEEAYVRKIIENHSEFIDQKVQEIKDHPSQIVAFSINGLNNHFAIEIARRLKKLDGSKIIVFGGPHCFKNELKDEFITSAYVDAICCFEGEKALPLYLDMKERQEEGINVPGMIYKDNNGNIIYPSDEECISDLNQLPFADFSDFDLSLYIARELPISTSRGCINRCLFCSEAMIWKMYRTRSAKNIYEEIVYQNNFYPKITSFFFNDSLLNGDIRVLNELCDLLIKHKVKISWGGQAAIREEMNNRLIAKMRKAGFSHVSYGLESASPRILKMIGKKFTPQIAARIIKDTKKLGVRTDVNIIVGFPGETKEDLLATAKFLRKNLNLIDGIFLHTLVISKGSIFFDTRERLGICFENKHNPNTWYSLYEDNDLNARMSKMRYLKLHIKGKGESFFTEDSYDLFVADDYFKRGDYKKAHIYYNRALKSNKNAVKDKSIRLRIEMLQKINV